MSLTADLYNKIKNKKIDENQFVLGLDIGNSTSSIVYFDVLRGAPEIIDISGGYGKANIPTAVQYIPETKEWVFGEYALLNADASKNDVVFKSMVDKLGGKAYVEIGEKLEPLINILAIYIKALLSSLKNINPKAEIAGIVVSIPCYMPEEAKEELQKAFSMIGYEKKLLGFVTDRECIVAYHYFGKRREEENILILDYGERQLRGGIYSVSQHSCAIKIKTVSYLFDNKIGAGSVEQSINKKLLELYADGSGYDTDAVSSEARGQVESFAYQHRDSIFQKNILAKGIRLYFNFAYPPFYRVFHKEDRDEITAPFKKQLDTFINSLADVNVLNGRSIDISDISTVLCTGGGFEMLWARQAVDDILPDSNVYHYKNPKAVGALGAAIIAAGRLGVIPERELSIEDDLKLNDDIGINMIKNGKVRFVSLFERNSFWWQNNKSIRIIVNDAVDGSFSLNLLKRSKNGEISKLEEIEIDGLPKRPKGVSEIGLNFEYAGRNAIKIIAEDLGFGEFFPKTDFYREYLLDI